MAIVQTTVQNLKNDGVQQFNLTDTITMNGATGVTSSYTFPRAFSATPKIIGCGAISAKAAIVGVSAISSTAITISIIGLSGNTDVTPVFCTIEGIF